MKRMRTWLALLCVLLTLTACGGNSSKSAASRPADNEMVSTDSAPQAPAEGGYGWATDSADTGMPEPAPEESGGGLPAGVKIIYTADVELETKEFDQASQALDEAVEELGGWFESRSLYQGGSYRSLSCTVRVPAEQFEVLLDRAGQAAHMVRREAYSEDVSEVYYDSEARLATQRTKLERLQTLLAQAATMEDIIALESALLGGMEFFHEGRGVFMAVPISLMERLGATENDAEDLSTLAGMVEDVDCGAVLRELKPDQWKLSLRTGANGRVNATRGCQLLGGGGHAMAAGATLEGSLEEVKARILEAVEQVRAW